MSVRSFIAKRPYLVWYTRDFQHLSDDAIVEAVLNYGDFEDIRKMMRILGIRKVAKIFRKRAWQERSNYRPEIRNYFKLYFNKHAPSTQRNFDR